MQRCGGCIGIVCGSEEEQNFKKHLVVCFTSLKVQIKIEYIGNLHHLLCCQKKLFESFTGRYESILAQGLDIALQTLSSFFQLVSCETEELLSRKKPCRDMITEFFLQLKGKRTAYLIMISGLTCKDIYLSGRTK